jgi:SAM-dependent methyltransferase
MFSEAEQQVLIAILAVSQGDEPAHRDNLDQLGKRYFRRSLVDWSGAFERLCDRGLIAITDGVYALTPDGEPQAAQLRAAHLPVYYFYRDYYTATQHSRAHADFCARVYGKDLCQHGYMDMAQLNKLLEVTNLSEDNRVLDLGCGNGLIADYMSDTTGAHVHGIDNNAEAIQQALERTAHKRDRLTFEQGDIYHLDLPAGMFDTAIIVDALYFGDIDAVISRLAPALRPGGQMAIYFMEIVLIETGDRSLIPADNTRLAQVLRKHDLPFRTWDFTQAEVARAKLSLQVAEDLKPAFEAEDNLFLYENRVREANNNIRFIEAGCGSRYLYHVRLDPGIPL